MPKRSQTRTFAAASTTPQGQFKWVLLGLGLGAFYLATSLHIASRRLFWLDEIFTASLVKLPSYRVIWKALLDRPFTEVTPIGYFVVVRTFYHLFGSSDAGMRIPSIIAMTSGLLIVFDCVRRVASGPCGLIAMGVLSCSFLPYYGVEARPYGLIFMFAAASLWLWLHGRGRTAVVAFGLVFAFAISIHYYACLCLIPYVLFELLYRKRGWHSPKLLAGIIGIFAGVAIVFPQVRTAHMDAATLRAFPRPQGIIGVYTEFFPQGMFLLGLVVVVVSIYTSAFPSLHVNEGNHHDPERLGWLFIRMGI